MQPDPTALAVPTDEALVAGARRGDGSAWSALYRRYVSEIYGYALNNLGDSQDAEDVTSETFERVVDHLSAYRGDASFRTWLYAIARNQLRDHFRRNGRHPTVDADPARLAAPEPAEDSGAAARPSWSRLGAEVMTALPENYRRVLELRILEERSVRETAAALGTTEGNVKVLHHRALRRASEIADRLGAETDGHIPD
jgi:RNA polymerase sigma-70 factor (ECF subfamily)